MESPLITGWLRSLATALRTSLVAALLLVATATAALAHASLNASAPADGSVTGEAPKAYALTFSEPVSPLTIKLIRPDGSSVPLDRFRVRDRTVEIEPPPELGRGTHVLSWRVVSADGHPIGGSVLFSIGEASAHAPLVDDPVDRTVRAGLWLSRIALYVGLFIGVGGVFALRVLLRGISAGRGIVLAALGIGAVGAILSTGFQGLDALGAPVSRLFDPVVWSAGFGTSFGRTVEMALAAFAIATLGLFLRGILGSIAATVALLAAAGALALSGHASAASPQWLMRPMVFLHVAPIAVWIGALTPLGLALKHNTSGAIMALQRFSRAIPVFVATLVAAGLVIAVVQVERPGALFDTAYGNVFLVKLGLLVGLFILVAVNRWSLTAAVENRDPSATRRLVRSIAVETLVAIAIFGAAAAWRFTPPPRVLAAEARLPASVQLQSDKATVVLWIGPARAGPVDMVANVLTAEFEPFEPREVTVTFSNPNAGIEPFQRTLTRGAGMADWHGTAVTIPLPGVWKVRVDVLVSDFETTRLEGEVRIRP